MKKMFLIITLLLSFSANAQDVYEGNYLCNQNSQYPFITNFSYDANGKLKMTRKFIGYSGVTSSTMTHQLGWNTVMFSSKGMEILLTFDTVYDNSMRLVISDGFSVRDIGKGIDYTGHCKRL